MRPALARTIALGTILALTLASTAIAPVAVAGSSVTRQYEAERYALRLLNCSRTGGWVRADGSCVGRNSGRFSPYRRPLRLHRKISSKVAWPWARTLAVKKVCVHDLPGEPGLVTRMRRSGFRYPRYGENIGCGSGDPKAAVLMMHRMMQAERATSGGHWRTIKSGGFKSVGIAVAVQGGTVRVVWDFYGKLY